MAPVKESFLVLGPLFCAKPVITFACQVKRFDASEGEGPPPWVKS